MEEKIHFMVDGLSLEGLFEDNTGDRGVVITHPHPLYGGNMHNLVVETIAEAYREKGYTLLRFNFRGVGLSQGGYNDGIGEQMDVAAALSYLADKGKERIDLAGYSFGAWVNAQAVQRSDIHRKVENLMMVSPPVGMIDGRGQEPLDSLRLVVTGSRDDIAPARAIEDLIGQWNPEAHLLIIDGADHFYFDHIGPLKSAIASPIG